jgi:hypothetical protein
MKYNQESLDAHYALLFGVFEMAQALSTALFYILLFVV